MNGEPHGEPDLPLPLPEKTLCPCWRCGKAVDVDLPRCPHCAAALSRLPDMAGAKRAARDPIAVAVTRMLGFFAGLLAVSCIAGYVARAVVSPRHGERSPVDMDTILSLAIGEEAVDTILVVAALVCVPIGFRHPSRTLLRRIPIWGAFVLVLAGLFTLNLRYHDFLRHLIGVLPVEEELLAKGDRLFAWFLLICVQPAIVEELFFRYLVLGTLRSVTGLHAAVWVSAVMFGLAHIGAPLSIPYLVLLGVGQGYARVASGGVLLPMVLHFLHNTAVFLVAIGWMAVP